MENEKILNLEGEITPLTSCEENQLKGGFGVVDMIPEIRFFSNGFCNNDNCPSNNVACNNDSCSNCTKPPTEE